MNQCLDRWQSHANQSIQISISKGNSRIIMCNKEQLSSSKNI